MLSYQQISGPLLDGPSWLSKAETSCTSLLSSHGKQDQPLLSPSLSTGDSLQVSRLRHSAVASLLQQSAAAAAAASLIPPSAPSVMQVIDNNLNTADVTDYCSLKQSPLCSPESEPSLPTFDVFRDTRTSQDSESLEYDHHFLSGLLRPLHLPTERLHNSDMNARGERVYCCMYCPYNSTRSDTLKVHIRTHTGEKPYICNICPYRCNQRSQLSRHIASKHGV